MLCEMFYCVWANSLRKGQKKLTQTSMFKKKIPLKLIPVCIVLHSFKTNYLIPINNFNILSFIER